jgi:hypothetical protein
MRILALPLVWLECSLHCSTAPYLEMLSPRHLAKKKGLPGSGAILVHPSAQHWDELQFINIVPHLQTTPTKKVEKALARVQNECYYQEVVPAGSFC